MAKVIRQRHLFPVINTTRHPSQSAGSQSRQRVTRRSSYYEKGPKRPQELLPSCSADATLQLRSATGQHCTVDYGRKNNPAEFILVMPPTPGINAEAARALSDCPFLSDCPSLRPFVNLLQVERGERPKPSKWTIQTSAMRGRK
jgi:hypothetical protein